MLKNPERHKIHCLLRFGIKALNNEAEYKALITRLGLVQELKVEAIDMYNNS